METARQQGVSVLTQGRKPVGGKRREKGDRRTGAGEAEVRPRKDVSVRDLFAGADESGLWLAFDHLQDPHNVGAVFRTAGFLRRPRESS